MLFSVEESEAEASSSVTTTTTNTTAPTLITKVVNSKPKNKTEKESIETRQARAYNKFTEHRQHSTEYYFYET